MNNYAQRAMAAYQKAVSEEEERLQTRLAKFHRHAPKDTKDGQDITLRIPNAIRVSTDSSTRQSVRRTRHALPLGLRQPGMLLRQPSSSCKNPFYVFFIHLLPHSASKRIVLYSLH